jgi:short-subunit dehydrogenase
VVGNIIKEHGRIDIIFNNAGIGIASELRDLSIDHWKKVMDINFYGVLYGSQLAYKQMLKQGHGQIVNTASLAGLIAVVPLIAPYSVSKHAVVNYTRVLRMEAKTFNIKANLVCPGVVDTAIFNPEMAINAKDGWLEYSIKAFAPGVSADAAAEFILKGVAKNKAIIIFPRIARVILIISRAMKAVYLKISEKSLKNYRDRFRIN